MLKSYFEIFTAFIKISSLTFGGGIAALPLLRSELVENRKWLSEEELTDIFSMSQIVPGLLYVSSATFIGYRRAGAIGAAVATIAVIIPSAVAIMSLYLFLGNLFSNTVVQKIMKGVIVGVTAMTAVVAYGLAKKFVNTKLAIAVFITSLVLIEMFKINAFLLILLGLLAGIIFIIIQSGQRGNADG